jgi:hypothetical protein
MVSTLGESIQFEFPKDILDSARLTVPELKVEMAVSVHHRFDFRRVNERDHAIDGFDCAALHSG